MKTYPSGTCFRFRVDLLHTTPRVWRSFLLRADASFFELHEAIQACGWTDSHLWHFREPQSPVVLAGLSDYDLGLDDPNAKFVRVRSHFEKVGDHCIYTYDFGDNWEHGVILEEVVVPESPTKRALLGGAGSFPPENSGGAPGLERVREFRETGKDPWGEDQALREFLEGLVWEEFDLERDRKLFDLVE